MEIPGTNITFEMAPVPAGKSRLGSPADEPGRTRSEGPQIKVAVRPYWIGRYEVTWGEYRQYYNLRNTFRRFDKMGLRKVTDSNRADAVTAPSSIYDPPGRLPADKRSSQKHPAVSMTQYGA
jgi:formylglycine-generating enzyme required for sulfatase activity